MAKIPNLNEQVKVRIDKIKKLKEIGEIVYKERWEKDGVIADILKRNEKEKVSAAGRIIAIREFGKLTFGHIKDYSGKIQFAIEKRTIGDEKYKFFKKYVDIADFIGIRGEIFFTKTGEKTILVKDYKLLTKALRPLPEKWHGIKDTEARYRQRYLDLIMNDESMNRFLFRSKLIKTIREYLEANGFIEVETPILQPKKSGALARPFITHHNALDIDVYLRIAPETYLKRCIAGGFDRVFEFAKSFRNEGIDPSHLQEFTMLEFYAAYWNYKDLMKFTEKLLKHVIKELFGSYKFKYGDTEINLEGEWSVYTFRDVILNACGIDINEFNDANSLKKAIISKGIELEDMDKLGKGNLIDALYKKVARPKMIQPQFLIHHPIDLSPLARRNDTNPDITDRFQLIINGWEIINAYSELVDPIDQRERFEKQAEAHKRGDEEALEMDEDFLLCMEHGMPPIAGWGMGIDRFVALLTNVDNLKDTVLFPLLKPLNQEKSEENIKTDNLNKNGVKEMKSENLNSKENENLTVNNSNTENFRYFPPIKSVPLTREEAYDLLKRYIKAENLIKHSLASAAVMEGLAEYFGQNKDVWYITGLLHDIDFEETKDTPEKHALIGAEILKKMNFPEEVLQAIRSHNEMTGVKRKNGFDIALASGETITGLIVATALVYPDKKLSSVQVKSIKKRMKKKDFARNVNREIIKMIELTGLELDKFIEISLESMKKIADQLGL